MGNFATAAGMAFIFVVLSIIFLRNIAGHRSDRALRLFFMALFARIGVASFVYLTGFAASIAGDSLAYDDLAEYFAGIWRAEGYDISWLWGNLQFSAVSHALGTVYVFSGQATWLALIIFGLLGAMSAAGVYLTAAEHFDERVGWMAGLFTAFLPSSVLWTALILKEAPSMLAIVVCIHCLLELHKRPRLRHLIYFAAAFFVLNLLRAYIAMIVVFTSLAALVITMGKPQTGTVYFARALLTVVLAIVIAAWASASVLNFDEGLDGGIQYLNAQRKSFTVNARTAYLAQSEYGSLGGAIAFLPMGMTYFLLSPFPWELGSTVNLLGLVEVPPWYILFGFAVAGVVIEFRRHTPSKSVVIVAVFALALTVMYSMISGNVGTAIRHRAQLLPAFMILAAVGYVARQQVREGGSMPIAPARMPRMTYQPQTYP